MAYRKHYIPLESNPAVFTKLIHQLGVSDSLAFHDVLSIADPELLALIPRPALALVLVFPTSAAYEQQKRKEEDSRDHYALSGEDERVIWYRQTINNACGLYGILHAVSNGDARGFIGKHEEVLELLQLLTLVSPTRTLLRHWDMGASSFLYCASGQLSRISSTCPLNKRGTLC